MASCVTQRASGGIGRRAGFRCQCPQGRGGSSPPSRTERRRPPGSSRGPSSLSAGAGGLEPVRGWAPPPEAPRAAQRRVEEAEGKSPLAHRRRSYFFSRAALYKSQNVAGQEFFSWPASSFPPPMAHAQLARAPRNFAGSTRVAPSGARSATDVRFGRERLLDADALSDEHRGSGRGSRTGHHGCTALTVTEAHTPGVVASCRSTPWVMGSAAPARHGPGRHRPEVSTSTGCWHRQRTHLPHSRTGGIEG